MWQEREGIAGRRRQLSGRIVSGIVLLAAACSAPIQIQRGDPDVIYRGLAKSALTGPELSNETRGVVWRQGIGDRWLDQPKETLESLHQRVMAEGSPEPVALAALAELALYAAQHAEVDAEMRRSLYLSAVVYAHLYLEQTASVDAFAPTFRMVIDVYNRALAHAFAGKDGEFAPASGRYRLVVGELVIDTETERFVGSTRLTRFLPAVDYEVEGMINRHRKAGVGVALIGLFDDTAARAADDRLADRAAVPLTALLRVEGGIAGLEKNHLSGRLEMVWPGDVETVHFGANDVPVEVELTTPVAYHFHEAKGFDTEVVDFFFPKEEGVNSLTLLEPHRKGRIPVVLVHGTASSPGRWADLINELQASRTLHNNYEVWLFSYASSSYAPVSAATLRVALAETRDVLDPRHEDPALDRMVVMGHSQGGLLARLQVSSSDRDKALELASDRGAAIAALRGGKLSDSQRAFLREIFVFEPSPGVERVIFLSTPQGGSYLTQSVPGWIAEKIVSIPSQLVDPIGTLTDVDRTMRGVLRVVGIMDWSPENLPTSLTSMTPGSASQKWVASLPFGKRVHVHSIVATNSGRAGVGESDGVVAWESAHLPEAESEIVVESGHSAQGHPEVIAEVGRILHEHLAAGGAPAGRDGPSAAPVSDASGPDGLPH